MKKFPLFIIGGAVVLALPPLLTWAEGTVPSPADHVGPALQVVHAAPEKRLVLRKGSRLWVKGATTQWSFALRANVLLGSAILKASLPAGGGEKALLAAVQKEGVQAMTLAVPVDQLKSTDPKAGKSANYSLAGPHQALKGGDNPYVQFRLEEVTLGKENKVGEFPLKASGKLTVGGVTRDIPLEAVAAFSGTQVRVKGMYLLRLRDFKVEPRSDVWGPMKPPSVEVYFDVLFGPPKAPPAPAAP